MVVARGLEPSEKFERSRGHCIDLHQSAFRRCRLREDTLLFSAKGSADVTWAQQTCTQR